MNDIEQELKKLRRSAPSDQLDVRVARSLASRSGPLSRPIPLWACAAACAACLIIGWLGHRRGDAGGSPAIVAPTAATPERPARLSPFIGCRFADSN